MSNKESFVKGAAILGLAGLFVKIIGAVYRIPLTSLIGTEGMAYYTAAYNVYYLFLTLSVSGIPTAIARLVSEKRALGNYLGAYQVYKTILVGMLAVGVFSSLIIMLFAKPIVEFMGFPGSYYSMLALIPALFIIPLVSVYRGFFQGMQDMGPFGMSQFLEQVLRVIVGYTLAITLMNVGLEQAAAGATFGASAGSMIALAVVYIAFLRRKKLTQSEIKNSQHNKLDTTKKVVKDLLVIAVPIAIGASIAPLMGNIDTYFVANGLSGLGFSQAAIDDLYGQLNGMAMPIVNFPQAISTAIAISLVPVITESYVRKDKKRLKQTADMGLKLSLIIALPCGVGIFMLAEPIMALLYPSTGAAAHASSGELLQILAVSVIFLIMVQSFTAMLQAVNKQLIPVKNLFIGLLLKIVLSYILIRIPAINIKGAPISTGIAYFVAMILNLRDIRRYTTIKLSSLPKISFLPFVSTMVMAVVVGGTFGLCGLFIESTNILTLLSIATGGSSYLVALFATGTITKSDLELIPMGSKLQRFARK